MSFFKKIKRNIKAEIKKSQTPDGTVYFEGEYVPLYKDDDSLPQEFKTLRMMMRYYNSDNIGGVKDRETYKKIVVKAYEMVQSGVTADPHDMIKRAYIAETATQEELDVFRLKEFCEKIDNMFVPQGDVSTDEHYVVKKDHLSPYSSYAKHYAYFEKHITEIISAVCRLVEREKKEQPMLYPGYCMYQDLMRYAKDRNRKKEFTPKIWAQSRKYLDAASSYYDIFQLSKTTDKDKIARAEANKKENIDPITREARINIQICSEEELLEILNSTARSVAAEAKALQDGIRHQKALADSGDVDAMAELGKNRYYGRNGIPKDTARAFILFSKAEKAGSGEAAYYLGEFYEKGVGHIIMDAELADEYYRKALHSDYVPAIARQADKERKRGDRQNAASHYKKILAVADEKEHTLYIKKAIAYLISRYARVNVDENTLSLVPLAFDYMRLDATLVKKSDRDILTLMDQAQNGSLGAVEKLEYYYDEYSHGPRAMGTIPASEIYQKDPDRAWEMKQVVKALRLLKVTMLLEKASNEPEKYLHELATTYIELGDRTKAASLVEAGIRSNMPSMLYVAYYYHKELGYEKYEAMEYLKKAANMGHKDAIGALEYLGILQEGQREREAWVAANKPTKTRRDYAFELEILERDMDIMLGGDGSSFDENALMGRISFTDASLLRHYKNKFLDKVSEE